MVQLSEKSPEAFRTISEVATELDVPQHVLRFWESKFSQIKPMKRGGGRRYYRPEDVELIKGVRTLLYTEGYTIKGVQKVFREHGLRYVMEAGKRDKETPVSARLHNAGTPMASAAEDSTSHFLPQELSEEQYQRLELILESLTDLKDRLDEARAAFRSALHDAGTEEVSEELRDAVPGRFQKP